MTSADTPPIPVVPPIIASPPTLEPPRILRQGNLFVVASGSDLPHRCLKCNSQASDTGFTVRLKWRPDPGIVSRLPIIRTAYMLTPTQNGTLTVYLCPTHRKEMEWRSKVCFLVAVVCFVVAAVILALTEVIGRKGSDFEQATGGFAVLGAIIGFAVGSYTRNGSLDMKHYDSCYMWIAGAEEPFLASLPVVPDS